jgi:hypothetical protein
VQPGDISIEWMELVVHKRLNGGGVKMKNLFVRLRQKMIRQRSDGSGLGFSSDHELPTGVTSQDVIVDLASIVLSQRFAVKLLNDLI